MNAAPQDVTLEAALDLVASLAPAPAAEEEVALDAALGRVLATPVRAALPVPPFDQAAVDGWAVRLADCAGPDLVTRLRAEGRVAAGQDATHLRVAGRACRIFTGAMLPPGADAVAMQEHVTRDGLDVVVPRLAPGRNIRRRGEQVEAGAPLFEAGDRLGPAHLALAVSAGLSTLPVRRRLRVGVLSTGDEIVSPGIPLPPAGVPDSNGTMLAALLAQEGCLVVRAGPVGDDAAAIAVALGELAGRCDCVLSTGGVSVGEEDHLRAALSAVGRPLFLRTRLKPGRPVAMGTVGRTPLLALPGPPAAALTAFAVLGRRLLHRLAGKTARPPVSVTLGFPFEGAPDLCHAVPVTVDRAGMARAIDPRSGGPKGGLQALAQADGLVLLRPIDGSLATGAPVPFVPLHVSGFEEAGQAWPSFL